jgi:hypothetical protein
MDPKVIDTLRHVFTLAVILTLGIIGYKFYKKTEARKHEVVAMRGEITDTNFYHGLRDSDAKATLLRCIGHLQRAHQLGIEPGELFDSVFDRKKSSDLIDEHADGYPTAQKLVQATITTAWQHAGQLHMFDEPDALNALLSGEMPVMNPAPVIDFIIDPALSPGIERVVPNLQLLLESKKPGAIPTDIEVNATRQLVFDLTDAGVIDHNAQKRIIDDYEAARSKRGTPPPVAVPAP